MAPNPMNSQGLARRLFRTHRYDGALWILEAGVPVASGSAPSARNYDFTVLAICTAAAPAGGTAHRVV